MSNSYLLQVNIESILAFLCLIIWSCTCIQVRYYKVTGILRYLWVMLLISLGILISDIAAIMFRGNTETIGYYMVRISNLCVFACTRAMLAYTAFYAHSRITAIGEDSEELKLAKLLTGFSYILLLFNLYIPIIYSFDSSNHYYRMNGWYIWCVIDLISTVLILKAIVQKRHIFDSSERVYLHITIIAPLAAGAIQLFIYGISILTIIIGVTQIVLFIVSYLFTTKNLTIKEAEIADYSARLTLSQLQPHFLMNALSAIQYLCKTAPDEAAETIKDLNVYIRNNMEFSQLSGTIPLARELDHVEKYIAIERKRFGDRVNVDYDIEEDDFMLPPLTIQPLVENAVKHGISKKRSGGTVLVRTWKEPDYIGIQVIDDGVGFDTEAGFSTDRMHFGMQIVRERLQQKCNGTMTVKSVPGEGTTIELTIPIEIG